MLIYKSSDIDPSLQVLGALAFEQHNVIKIFSTDVQMCCLNVACTKNEAPALYEIIPKDLIVNESGAGWGTRTPDLMITNQLLYQLS